MSIIKNPWGSMADNVYSLLLSIMFSLLVMMVLVSVVVQEASTYLDKSKFTEFYSVFVPVKGFVSEFYSYHGRLPDNDDMAKCEFCFSSADDFYNLQINPTPYYTNGAYEFSINMNNTPSIIMMRPVISQQRATIIWNCGYALAPGESSTLGNSTSINPNILPNICR